MPVVLLFKGGVMYSFHGGGFSVERLMQFAERDYVHSSRMLVPPEPHVATPHDQTFLSSSRLIRPSAVAELGSCASSERACRPWAAQHAQGKRRAHWPPM